MLLKLVQIGEAILRQKARELRPAEITSEPIRQLIRLMHQTLRDAPGVGLAAPQIGEPIQLAIIEDLPEYSRNLTAQKISDRERKPVPFHVIINPVLSPVAESKAEFFEGCLSVSGFTALVPRYRSVRVECLDENAEPRTIEASGWYARILQHEIDHLNGMLYVDRMYPRSLMSLENYTREWRDVSEFRVKAELGLGDV
jgi:peptide deformylase